MIFSIANTFIKRPVLTTVCTLLILIVGGVCIPLLPLNPVLSLSENNNQSLALRFRFHQHFRLYFLIETKIYS
ncbi:hypothetical protein [Nostoc sp.]|uniref:hypothetical protein n=1 Tax=Nostoc sp. TaxID=1180 RepID=UPI002FF7753A